MLGITATPERGDRQGLDSIFQEIVFEYSIVWGMRSGYLSDLRAKRLIIEAFSLDDAEMSHGDYDEGDLGDRLMDAGAPSQLAEGWLGYGENRKTLVFCPTVNVAGATAAAFEEQNIVAAMVHGGTPLDERRAVLAAFKTGEIRVLTNCMVATEGFDEPSIQCVMVARPTTSRGLYEQMVGRGTRRHPGKKDGLIIDAVGVTAVHDLMTLPSLFGVGKPKKPHEHSRSMLDLLDEHDEEEIRAGRLRAEEVALFAKVRQGGIAWVSPSGISVNRPMYVRTLGRGKPVAVLRQSADESWDAVLSWEGGDETVLVAGVDLELAQGIAEGKCRTYARGLVDLEHPWRQKPPTENQLEACRKWKCPIDPEWKTAGECSDALDLHILIKTGRLGGATMAQSSRVPPKRSKAKR